MPPRSRARRGTRALVAVSGLALATSSLAFVAVSSPAHAADPVTLNLLGVNDFHGRINSTTVQWAGTVEQLTEAGGADSTLLVGAGDLIGASEFASAVADDQPTIDVFNALGLDASAVGNHEFDQGFADLRDRVIGRSGDRNAQWAYLGANVYKRGTTTPALPEYAAFTVDGIKVAVIGAVTQETAHLVNPGGIEDITFGDPVQAVNRVAGELSDGNPANGEAQVIVASFHSGAQVGAGSTYDAEVAKGGEFAEMADLDPAVNVIFNGHTHQTYAWNAPVPGEPGVTRPILQTGSYGANVGQVSLTVDPMTGGVTAYAEQNVAGTTTPDADLVSAYPAVAQVKQIVDAAVAHASEVGNKPVGSVTGSVTTAYTGGSYTDGRYAGGTRDDRASESTLGDLVGNALRDGIPSDMGKPDIGITNPGGLRAELLYAGDTTSNPANTDGVVTYAEANNVLPFVNNIWLVKLTGSDLETVLEQQWQTNPGGAAPSRPYLQLGLSDNVRVTSDPNRPEGSRITSVRIDGKPLDPDHVYTVSTVAFLGTGGDNFRAFTHGAASDTGLVDRDLWISYLRKHPRLDPDFARQQVEAPGMPTTVSAGDAVHFELGRLDLTSQGAPANTSVSVFLTKGTKTIAVGDFPVTDGTASVSFAGPADLNGAWQLGAVAKESGTQIGAPRFTRAASATSARMRPAQVVAGRTRAEVTVTVRSGGGPATGTVRVTAGGRTSSAPLTGGKATVALRKFLSAGKKKVTVVYLGTASTLPSKDALTIKVVKKK